MNGTVGSLVSMVVTEEELVDEHGRGHLGSVVGQPTVPDGAMQFELGLEPFVERFAALSSSPV